MPHYEYFCDACQKGFDLVLTLREHDQAVECPYCKSKDVHQLVSSFSAVTSKKS